MSRFVRVVGLLLSIALVYGCINLAEVWWVGRSDQARAVDAIVVLGVAQYDGRPSPQLQARLDHVLTLWQEGLSPLVITTGGNQPGDRFTEAEASANYLIDAAVPSESIVQENIGSTTRESLIAVRDIMQAEMIAAQLRAQSGQLIESWIQTNNQIFSAIKNQDIMTLLIRFFITVVVSLGIASVLVVSVVQKRKEIGILRAVGATRGQMMRVFLWQGAMVGAAGALLGTAFGLVLISVFSRILRSEKGVPLFTMAFDAGLTGIVFAVAVVLGVIAAVLPARNAARLDPAQAIRG